MFKKVILASILASILGLVVFYLIVDLLGSQIILKEAYLCSQKIWRHNNFLSRDISRVLKYFVAFLLTNVLWSYIFSLRQKAFTGTGVEKGIKFFFLLWLLTIPVHFWYWILVPYSKKILLYNVLIYYLVLFLSSGAIIGKVCAED